MPDLHAIASDAARPAVPLMLLEKPFNESWLQEVLFRYPATLPLDEIEPGYGPLVPLCRELGTASGYVDNLFVNHRGQLTLVECKLWRNAEARRKVVAQILDYAKDLTMWGLSDLALNARLANKTLPEDLYESLPDHPDKLNATAWSDTVNRNLRLGKMLLLIVGDGIREETANLTAFLQSYAHLSFTLGLVEMPVYEHAGEWILAPRVALKTQIVNRVVVQQATLPNKTEENADEEREEAAAVDSDTAAQQQAHLAFWSNFLDAVPEVQDAVNPKAKPSKGATIWLSIFPSPMPAWIGVFTTKGCSGGGVYAGFPGPKGELFALGRRMYDLVSGRKDELEEALGTKLEWLIRAEQPVAIWRLPPTAGRTPAETMAWLVKNVPTFMKVMRPALISAHQEALAQV